MERDTHPLDGISLAWWPSLLQHSPARPVVEVEPENRHFTGLLHNLALALKCSECCDLEEEITLP